METVQNNSNQEEEKSVFFLTVLLNYLPWNKKIQLKLFNKGAEIIQIMQKDNALFLIKF